MKVKNHNRIQTRGTSIPSRVQAALLTVSIICFAACSSGGGGGSVASFPSPGANGIASTITVTSLPDNEFQFDFTLESDVSKELGIDVEYSENLGATYQEATVMGADPIYSGSPAGTANHVIWAAGSDLSDTNQQDLTVRITPYNLNNGIPGDPATSTVFGIGSGAAPVVLSLSTPGEEVGGWVTFTYTVSDVESDHVSISSRFSLNGGGTFQAATIGGGDGTTALTTSPTGTEHTIEWHVQEDVPETFDSNVRFEITASDVNPSSAVDTRNFSIRTYAPRIDLLTINRIPTNMNGSTTFTNTAGAPQSYRIVAPESNFEIWLEFSTHFLGATVDSTGFFLSNSRDIGGGSDSGGIDADTDFSTLLSYDMSDGTANLMITSLLTFAASSHTLTLELSDSLGNTSAPQDYTFDTSAVASSKVPFENTDYWYLRFDRDNFTITSSISSGGTVTVSSTAGDNGTEDFTEDLRILGLNSESPPPAAASAGLNTIVLDLIKDSIRGHLSTHYLRNFDGTATEDSANVSFVLSWQEGALSQISIGGDDPSPGFTLGRASFDHTNVVSNVNTAANLGIFTTNLIDFFINSSATFKSRFDPLIPGRGTALGFHVDDVTVLSPDFDRMSGANTVSEDARYDDIMEAVDAMGRSVSVILAHEIGHSVGLVANGTPPGGLFGNEFNAAFSGPYTDMYHLDTPGNNIMQASISFSGTVATGSGAPFFNELITAYLQQRTLTQ